MAALSPAPVESAAKASADSECVATTLDLPAGLYRYELDTLDASAKRVERDASLLEALAIENNGMRQDRIAELREPLKRQIPQVGNDKIQLLFLKAH